MTVTVYKSTDAGAPTLTGAVGSLITLLDAVLVNGYGSKPSAGWTKAFSGTNKASYKQPAGSNGFYLDVDDTGRSGANLARWRGFETMTAVGTGAGPFPSDVQVSGGLYFCKSYTTDTTARPWVIYTNGKMVYFVIGIGDTTFSNGFVPVTQAFGDFTSFKPGDTYNTVIISSAENNYGGGSFNMTYHSLSPISSHYVCRPYTATVGGVTVGKLHDLFGSTNSVYAGNSGLPYPNFADGGLYLSPIRIVENSNALRGILPGIWVPQFARTLSHFDTYAGTGVHAGKNFECCYNYQNSGVYGNWFFETSNTW